MMLGSRSTKTALSQHAVNSSHVFDFDGTVILANEDQIKKRKIREIVEIMKDRKSVNFKSDDIDDLHDAYRLSVPNIFIFSSFESGRNIFILFERKNVKFLNSDVVPSDWPRDARRLWRAGQTRNSLRSLLAYVGLVAFWRE